MNRQQRIGVFGGTFDPVHNTHLEIARTALQYAHLDKVLFVVSASPPHKSGEVAISAEERYLLVDAALRDEPTMQACRLEVEREGPSYTADTIKELGQHYPNAALYLIIGSDSLVDLPKWYNPRQILDAAHLLVVPRPGTPEPIPAMVEGHYDILPFKVSSLSSTEIRQNLSEGKPVNALIPDTVSALIHKKGLYNACHKNRTL